jgi:aspartate carbamoyltransferase catalytic subunit
MSTLQHIIGAKQFSREDLEQLFISSQRMESVAKRGGNQRFSHKIMTTLFFEASTRTRLSFESAMHRLGGRVLGT